MTWMSLFEWVFRASIMGGATVLLIMVVLWLLQRRIHVKWHYFIWLLLPIRLLLPWTPDSPFSLFQLIPEESASPHAIADTIVPGREVETGAYVGGQMIITSTAPSGVGDFVSPLMTVAFWVWVAGAVVTGAILLYRSIRIARLARSARPLADPIAADVLASCKQRMAISADIPLLQADFIATPALYGIWRPVLLMPGLEKAAYSAQEYRHIFTHELIHYKRKDIAINWLMSLLLVLHWFNPLLWIATYRMRAAQEMSCDAAALSTLGASEAVAYGHTLIKLLEKRQLSRGGPRTAYFSEATSYFRKRIAMIAGYRRATLRAAIIGTVCLLLLGCAALTNPSADSDVVAEFRDYKITKQQLKQIYADNTDEHKIKTELSLHMMVLDAKALGYEPDMAAVDKSIEDMKKSTDPETRNAHLLWMERYGLKGDAYWEKRREDLILSGVLNQYAMQLFGDPKVIGGSEYKKKYNEFMDATYEKYKSEVRVYYDRLENRS
jgi:beta-lactamase regulating signal transducer with metallopeptidase domain